MISCSALQNDMVRLLAEFEDLGVFVAMFLESSIIPLPSEVIVIAAGALGIPLVSIVIFGSLGSTAGALVGYLLGRYAAMPVILKLGKYILIKPHHIHKAEVFAKKYGVAGVLVGRMLPVVPFKVFSIAAGITNIPLVPFLACTLIGVVPRMYLLAVFGSAILQYKKPAMVIAGAVILIIIAFKLTKMFYNNKNNTAGGKKHGSHS
jgi:membrane protein DedA with SNARE-associated domain